MIAALQITATDLLEVLIEGLGTAGVYVMIASGLSLIFGLMGVLNFAHGALTTVGGYVGGALLVFVGGAVLAEAATASLGVFVFWLAAILLTGVVLAILGSMIEVALVRQLYDRPPIDQILLTFGVALVIQQVLRIVVGLYEDPDRHWTAAESAGPWIVQQGNTIEILGLAIKGIRIMEFALGALVVVGVWAFLNRTRYGLYIRAGTEDAEMAEALGINVRQVFTVVFGIGIGLAGMAGTFLIWEKTYDLTVLMGAEALLPAFIVVVVGGLGTFKGTVVASVIAGIFTEAGVFLSTTYEALPTQLPSMLIFLLLVGVLVLKPQGLFGQAEVGGH
ncbi:MAG: branched-chain amino acid ABC transporter permease [Haloarculaceae archaeon]